MFEAGAADLERNPPIPTAIEFGRFHVLPLRRELLADGRPIKLGGRAFDVLLALIGTPGAVISKEALIARAWPDRIVEENNLQTQIKALRKVLGTERELIRTIAGRGYQFTGDVRELSASSNSTFDPAVTEPGPTLPSTNVPEASFELIGRDEELGEILNLAAGHRLVTLTGAGGIGKTTLALALARELRPHFADGVWLAEFSGLADQGLVPAAVAAAVGLELGGADLSAKSVAQALANRHLLLVLDTCEHVSYAAASLAEAMLGAGSGLHIIASSREPLRAQGEWVYPVRPLAVPAPDAVIDDDPSRYGAVRLFIERARAAESRFAPGRNLVATIAAICRRLDGIPLAIELAAARVHAFGVEELAARLDDRLGLLSGGRRTALPRHQTLRATLDWSYALLVEAERALLRRLSVFAGAFSLRAANAIAVSADTASLQVVDGLSNLLAKSLVVADAGGSARRYRLLDTTRAYALEKLRESGEQATLMRRHAEYYQAVFDQADAEWETRPAADWLTEYGREIDNLRAALDWAFSPAGEVTIGVALAGAAVPLWMHLSSLPECRGRVEQALAALAAGADRDERREMKLQAALGSSLIFTRDAAGPEIGAAWTRTLEIAERLEDTEHQLRALWGLCVFQSANGRYRAALALAQRLLNLAANRPDPTDRLIGEHMIGASEHLMGDQPSARRHLERVLADYVAPNFGSHITRFLIDIRVPTRVFLARTLWLQGFPDQAMRIAHSIIDDAVRANHAISLCYALTLAACPIALWIGDLATAGHYVEMLLDHATKYGLALWQACGRSYQGLIDIERGHMATGLPLLRASLEEVGEGRFAVLRFLTFQMANALGHAGHIADGLAEIEKAIAQSEEIEGRCLIAEMLRAKGELLLQADASDAATVAEDLFLRALHWANHQGALSWELRAATSLARLQRDQGNPAKGTALLQPIYDRFTEGFETADLKAARMLLSALRGDP